MGGGEGVERNTEPRRSPQTINQSIFPTVWIQRGLVDDQPNCRNPNFLLEVGTLA